MNDFVRRSDVIALYEKFRKEISERTGKKLSNRGLEEIMKIPSVYPEPIKGNLVLLDIDERFSDVISITFIGMREANNFLGHELTVQARCIDLREGNYITIDSNGQVKTHKTEGR